MIVCRCPSCGKSTALWQALSISGWQALREDGTPDPSNREADWAVVEELAEGGCGDCGWDGPLGRMSVTLGIDGEPLPEVSPNQLALIATEGREDG